MGRHTLGGFGSLKTFKDCIVSFALPDKSPSSLGDAGQELTLQASSCQPTWAGLRVPVGRFSSLPSRIKSRQGKHLFHSMANQQIKKFTSVYYEVLKTRNFSKAS